ncbi:MAG: Thiamine kinase [Chlamydiia bacterium]|nr:Thiamine kinase [Chlamydiia bacterium]
MKKKLRFNKVWMTLASLGIITSFGLNSSEPLQAIKKAPLEHSSMPKNIEVKEKTVSVIQGFANSLGRKLSTTDASQAFKPLKKNRKFPIGMIQIQETPYIVRTFNPKLSIESRKREILSYKKAGEHYLAPKIVYIDTDYKGYITEFITAPRSEYSDFKNPKAITKLGIYFKKLHSTETSNVPHTLGHHELILNNLNTLKIDDRSPILSSINEIRSFTQNASMILEKHYPNLCLTHLDVFYHNLFQTDSGLQMIDWETAGLSLPCYDLAMASVYMQWSDKDDQLFLHSYYGRAPSQEELDLFYLAKVFSYFYEASVFLKVIGSESLSSLSSSQLNQLNPLKFSEIMSNISKHNGAPEGIPLIEIALRLTKDGLSYAKSSKVQNALNHL